jgi:transposase
VSERCEQAVIRLDPFHIAKAATDALDKVRREVWNEARRQGQTQLAKELKGARFALWKNPANLTERQRLKLSPIQKLNQRLYPAYLLAQQPRQIYLVPAKHALMLLEAWLKWARRCRLEPFQKPASRITEQRHRVKAAITAKLSNAQIEQVNTQIRLITRPGFGYHSPWAVIALAMLSLVGLCRPLTRQRTLPAHQAPPRSPARRESRADRAREKADRSDLVHAEPQPTVQALRSGRRHFRPDCPTVHP